MTCCQTATFPYCHNVSHLLRQTCFTFSCQKTNVLCQNDWKGQSGISYLPGTSLCYNGIHCTQRITRATSVTVNTDSWLRVQITRWQWQSCVQLWYELWDRRILRGRYNPSSLWLAECHQIMNKPQLSGRFLNICYGWKLAISMYSLATSCWASKWFSQMSWKLVHSSSHDPLHCGMHAECSQQLLLSTYHYELENWDGVVWPTNLVYHHQPSSLSWSIITEP